MNGSRHSIQTIYKCLIGYQPGKPIKQVLFSERMDLLDTHVTLFITDKQVNCQNFLVCEYRFRIIAVSSTVIIPSLTLGMVEKGQKMPLQIAVGVFFSTLGMSII